MRTFGPFEARGEIARTALSRVWRAGRGGEAEDRYAIKALDCGSLSYVADESVLEARIGQFLDVCGTQAKAGPGWAPVHATGRTSDGAYYVTDLYPLSAARLIDGRAVVGAGVLVNIVTGIVAAIRSMRDSQGRGHGNLRPSNVFLARASDIDAAPVLVADPCPAHELGADGGEVADARAIGELIHQIVLHKPFAALGGWPVPPGPAWSRLGKVGEGWRSLCSDLLNPDLQPGMIGLDEIAARAASLTPPPRRVWPYVAVAAAVVALMVGGWTAWERRPSKPLEWSQELWRTLCEEDDRWVGEVIEAVRAVSDDPRVRPRVGSPRPSPLGQMLLERDPELFERLERVLAEASEAGSETPAWMRDRWADRVPGIDISNLELEVGRIKTAEASPLALLSTRRLPRTVSKAWDVRPEDRADTSPPSKNARTKAMYAAWYGRFVYDELRGAIEARRAAHASELDEVAASGLEAPRTIASLREDLERAALWNGGQSPAEGVDAFTRAGIDIGRLATGWGSVVRAASEAVAVPEAAGDPVVAGSLVASGAEVRRVDASRERAEVLRVLESWANATVAIAALCRDHGASDIRWADLPVRPECSPAYGAIAAGELSAERFVAWVAAVGDEGYWNVADARPKPGAAERFGHAERALAGMEEACRESAADEIAALQVSIAEARARLDEVERLPWIRKNRVAIEGGVAEAEKSGLALQREAESLVEQCGRNLRQEIDAWLAEAPGAFPTEVEAIRDAWVERRAALAASLGADPTRPGRLWSALRRTRRELMGEPGLNGRPDYPGIAGRLAEWEGVGAGDRPASWDAEAEANAVRARRELAAARMIAALGDWDAAAVTFDAWEGSDAARSSMDGEAEALGAWSVAAASLAADYARVERLIAEFHGHDERPADGGPSIVEIVERWGGDALGSDVLAAVAEVSVRVEILRSVPSEDRASLERRIVSAEEPDWSRFAAWRAIGVRGFGEAWPASVDELDREIATRERVLEDLGRFADARRAASLRDEVGRAGPARWGVAVLHAGPEHLDAVMGRREAMGVSGVDGLDPRAAWNVRWYEFAGGLRENPEDEAALSAARGLLASVGGSDAAGPRRAILGEIGAIIDNPDKGPPITEVLDQSGPRGGPLRDGWAIDWTRSDQRPGVPVPAYVEYKTTERTPRRVLFWHVPGASAENGDPVYLSAEEVSFSLASYLVSKYPGGVRALERAWLSLASPESCDGVVLWTVIGGFFDRWSESGWIRLDTTVRESDVYPDAITVSPPGDLLPLQWIEPTGAETLASLLGCRLPTAAEWRSAKDRYERVTGANRRDLTFVRFRDHVRDLNQRGARLAFPDRGIFTGPGGFARGETAQPAASEDDGTLWFEPVTNRRRGQYLQHMVGNVAEFVTEGPAGSGDARYAVIGASALSPPEIDPLTAYPVRADGAFCDVGFRLAFVARGAKRPVWSKMLDVMEATPPYIFAEGR